MNRSRANAGAWAWLGVCAAVALAYAPVWHAGFIWNDSDYVTAPALRSLGGLGRIWTEVGATEQYYPVLHSWFWVQQWIFGDAPVGYHVVNVALHALAAGLFALVLRRLAVPGAWFAAAVFALHPVAVESVAWISEQKNTLSLAFYLAAALAWLRFEERRAPRDYAVASALFALALLSKSVTATLPAALLVVAWWRRGRIEWTRDVRPLVPWFAAGAVFGLFTAWVEHRVVGAHGADFDLGLIERVLLAGRVSWFYLGKLVWPAELIFIYPRWDVSASVWWQWLFPAALLGALALAWRMRDWSRAPLAAGLFFLGSLFPTMGFFNVYAFQFSFVADHWQYLPMLGPIALFAGGAATFAATLAREQRLLAGAAGAALCALLGGLSWAQSGLYRDIETFYRRTLAANPDSWMGRNNLGLLLLDAGRADEALTQLREATRLKPRHAEVANNLGAAWRATGHAAASLTEFRRATELKAGYVEAEFNLALALAESGAAGEAEEHYRRVLALRPTHAKAANNLGNLLLAERDAAGAIELFRVALAAAPDFADAHHNLGVAFFAQRRAAEAAPELRRALELDPARDVSRWLLAIVLAGERPVEAVPVLEELVRRQPAHADAHQLLAQCLWQLGRKDEAARAAAEAERLRRR
ncbi:MAG: tetratricopeptide repeat protein [Opitutae bacterium]|nr:tetratricopeptide repeat protein [Opitutae bacterium]